MRLLGAGHGANSLSKDEALDYLVLNSIVTERGCWEWLGHLNEFGYGTCCRKVNGQKLWLVHRWSWTIRNHKIPERMSVLHRCDNPACVNPDHLWLGTMQENTLDMVRKGRANRSRGVNNARHKVSENDVVEIRRLSSIGISRRAVARIFGITHASVKNISLRITWRHVL